MLLQQIISQTSTKEAIRNYFFNEDILDVFYTGTYGALVSPKSIFHKGDTYVTGVTNEATQNPVLYRYRNGVVDAVDVGVIDNTDPLDHQHPAIFIQNDFIYIAMVNGHGEDIKIWKSITLDILDGFSLHHTIIGGFGYLSIFPQNNLGFYFISRITAGSPLYSHKVGFSNGEDLTSWTVRTITDANYAVSDNRHYPSIPRPYGLNQWYYFCINLRNETSLPEIYFAQAYYKTQDFITYHSLDELFSKDIVLSGAFTETEIENNLTYIGSNTAPQEYVGLTSGCVINDIIYGSYYDSLSYWKFYKIQNGIKTEYICNIPNISGVSAFTYHLVIFFNGKNLVIRTSLGKIYHANLNFGNQIELFNYLGQGYLYNVNLLDMPYNLDSVYGNYILGGGNEDLGVFPYIVTDDKFFL